MLCCVLTALRGALSGPTTRWASAQTRALFERPAAGLAINQCEMVSTVQQPFKKTAFLKQEKQAGYSVPAVTAAAGMGCASTRMAAFLEEL